MVREPADFSSLAPYDKRRSNPRAMLRPRERRSVSSAPRHVKEETVIRRVYPLSRKISSFRVNLPRANIPLNFSRVFRRYAEIHTSPRSDHGIFTGLWRIKYLSTTNVECIYISRKGAEAEGGRERGESGAFFDRGSRFPGRKTLDRSESFS